MKHIKITPLFQPPQSKDCGPVSLQMILHHFGRLQTLEELTKDLLYVEHGTYIYDNARQVMKSGCDCTLITGNPLIFPKEAREEITGRTELLRYLARRNRNRHFMRLAPQGAVGIERFRAYVKVGGQFSIKVPDKADIVTAIDSGALVLALLLGQAMGECEGGFHFVVVSGYKNGHVYINNPAPKSRQGWFSDEDFFYALHSAAGADVDNGSLLVVSGPKK